MRDKNHMVIVAGSIWYSMASVRGVEKSGGEWRREEEKIQVTETSSADIGE